MWMSMGKVKEFYTRLKKTLQTLIWELSIFSKQRKGAQWVIVVCWNSETSWIQGRIMHYGICTDLKRVVVIVIVWTSHWVIVSCQQVSFYHWNIYVPSFFIITNQARFMIQLMSCQDFFVHRCELTMIAFHRFVYLWMFYTNVRF